MIPVISGTVAGQTVDGGNTINPFTNVSIIDPNDHVSDVTLTITSLDANGNPTDANGTLSIPAADLGNDTFTETSPGVYVLTNGSAPGPSSTVPFFQSQLADMKFIPTDAATTTFNLAELDGYGEHQTDTTTSVTASGATTSTSSAAPFDTSTDTSSAAPSDTSTDTSSAAPSDTSTDTSSAAPSDTSTDTSSAAPSDTSTDTSSAAPTDTSSAAPTDTSSAAPSDTSTDTSSTMSTNATTVTGSVCSKVTETLTSDSQLVIDHPNRFHGQVDLGSGDIDLNGLARADSYSFRNDMLTIYASNGKALDKLRLTSNSSAFSVEKTATGVSIYTADDTLHSSTGTLLPLHI